MSGRVVLDIQLLGFLQYHISDIKNIPATEVEHDTEIHWKV